jgi:hypothetical protein
MLVGSCLCGSVRYQCGDLASPIGLCHCRTCQKAHSSAYAPTARADQNSVDSTFRRGTPRGRLRRIRAPLQVCCLLEADLHTAPLYIARAASYEVS